MTQAALITGGAVRIGRAIALRLAQAGYDIALHYNRSSGEANRTADDIRSLGRQCQTFNADLSDRASLGPLIDMVLERLPECRTLVNSAAIFRQGPLIDPGDDLFDQHMRINFEAPFFLSRRFVQRVQAGGNIINILDTRVVSSDSAYGAYSLSKKALAELTRLAAREFAPNVRVNGVCPGLVLAPAGKDGVYLDHRARDIPLQRTGSPDDVASAVLFLMANTFITGQLIFVDGGEHLM